MLASTGGQIAPHKSAFLLNPECQHSIETGGRMLGTYFQTTFAVDRLRSGPSGPFVDGFAQQLERQGYSWWTARAHLRAAAHLGQFAQARDIRFDSIGRATLETFRLHLPSCRCPRPRVICHANRWPGREYETASRNQ